MTLFRRLRNYGYARNPEALAMTRAACRRVSLRYVLRQILL